MNRTVSLENEMDNFIKYLGLDEELQRLSILEVWRECVGEAISNYSTPVEIKRNKLLVSVENAVWRYELSARKDIIINKINSCLAARKYKKIIKEIIFV